MGVPASLLVLNSRSRLSNPPSLPLSLPPSFLQVFVGVILIPIVGNATEHMTAVSVAYKNRMELAMGIAVGSATQIRWVLALLSPSLPSSLPPSCSFSFLFALIVLCVAS